MADARAAALAALLHVDENEGFSNLVLDKTLARFALEPRDAAWRPPFLRRVGAPPDSGLLYRAICPHPHP